MVVRLANRNGKVFRISGLKYKELPEVGSILSVLSASGFTRHPLPGDGISVLETLTRPEIAGLLKPQKGLSSKQKSELIRIILEREEPVPLPDDLLKGFVVKERMETLEFLFFLFFGKHRRNLQALALRDLGIVRTRTGQSSFEVRFATREAATYSFSYAKLSEQISIADETGLLDLARGLSRGPECGEPGAASSRDREICRLGARLEKAGFLDDALGVYRHTDSHPARERICRILFSQKKVDEAKLLLDKIISNPSTDEELLFAEDFHARKFGGRRLSRLTNLLRSASVIEIDEAFRDSAEQAAVDHSRRRENTPSGRKTIFGQRCLVFCFGISFRG